MIKQKVEELILEYQRNVRGGGWPHGCVGLKHNYMARATPKVAKSEKKSLLSKYKYPKNVAPLHKLSMLLNRKSLKLLQIVKLDNKSGV